MNTYQKLGTIFALGLGFSAVANSSSSPIVLYDNLSDHFNNAQGIPPGWIANAFYTGPNIPGYTLGDITLKLTGNTEGNIQGVVLQLFDTSGVFQNPEPNIQIGAPGDPVGHAYVNPSTLTTTLRDNVFTPNALDASLVLSPNTSYWVKLDASALNAANVDWAYSSSGAGQWAFDTLGGDEYAAFHGDSGPFLMKVTATPISAIPIPGAAWLMGTGLIGLISSWRRKRTA